MKNIFSSSVLMITVLTAAGCANSGVHERQGAQVGAVAGAILGGIIGHQSGEGGAGAAIGAAAGAATGAAIGSSKDQAESQDRRYERDTVRAVPVTDEFGFSFDDYMRLLTNQEMEILQSRADARPEVPMGTLLTEQEKANLRRRAQANREIGR